MFKESSLVNRLLNESHDGCSCGICLLHRQAAAEIERLTRLLEYRPFPVNPAQVIQFPMKESRHE